MYLSNKNIEINLNLYLSNHINKYIYNLLSSNEKKISICNKWINIDIDQRERVELNVKWKISTWYVIINE